MKGEKRIGIGLSGGGYRAAGFHIGTLKKLSELNILKDVDVLSTISGGSITGAAYCLHQGDFKSFEEKMIHGVTTKSVIGYVLSSWLFLRFVGFCLLLLALSGWLLFTPYAPFSLLPVILLVFLLIRYQFKILPLSRIIEKAYSKFFFGDATLSGLCDKPEIAIGSTNLQTLRQLTFSKRKMEDTVYAYAQPPILFIPDHFPVARAVMASSCVPFAFTPVSIDKCFFQNPDLAATVDPKLVDGGVYDNQGVHKLTQSNSSYSCDIVIVSDAGNKLPFAGLYNNTLTLLLRTVDTFMARIKNFQMIQNIYQNHDGREIAYQSLGWDLDKCLPGFFDNLKAGNIAPSVIAGHQLQSEWVANPGQYKNEIINYLMQKCMVNEILAKALPKDRLLKIRGIGTNLTVLEPSLVKDMIIHSENLTELQIRLYCPLLIS